MDTKSFTLNQLIDIALCTPYIGMVNFKVLRVVLKVIVKELDIHDVCARVLLKDLQHPANMMESEKERRLLRNYFPPKSEKRSTWSSKVSRKDSLPLPKIPSDNGKPEDALSEDLMSEMSAYDFIEAIDPTLAPVVFEDEGLNEEENTTFSPVPVGNDSHVSRPASAVVEKSSVSESQRLEESEFENEPFPSDTFHLLNNASEPTVIVREESLALSSHIGNFIFDAKSEIGTNRRPQRQKSTDRASIISETRCSGNKWMIANMWRTMNFSRRIDAVETGMEKVVCVLDDHVKLLDQQRRDFERKRRDDDRLIEAIEENVDNLIDSVNDINARSESYMRVDDFKSHKSNVDVKFTGVEEELQHLTKLAKNLDEVVNGDKKLLDVYGIIDTLDERVKFLEENSGVQPIEDSKHYDLATLSRMFDEFMEKVKPVVERLEKDVDSEDIDAIDPTHTAEQLMNLRLNLKQLSADNVKLMEKVDTIVSDMKKQSETIDVLIEAKENGIQPEEKQEFHEMQRKFKIVEKDCEQLQLIPEMEIAIATLQSGKAEKAEIEEALARKPEFDDIDRKVDKNIYETAIQDITDSLQDVTHRVDIQEERLLRSMQTISVELCNKVDKGEVEGITDTIHSRLKTLAAKLKQLQFLVECDVTMPAGTKMSVATCISCNRPMRKATDVLIKSVPVDYTRSSKVNLRIPENGILSSKQCDITPTECDHTGRNTGGPFTITNPQVRTAKFPGITTLQENDWKEVPLEGTDHVVYRGKIEKLPPMPQ